MTGPRKTDWRTVLTLAAMYVLLAGNYLLYRVYPLSLVVHILISTLAIHLAFTVWHEAVHRNVSPRGWINDAVGVVGILPYMFPYFLQKWIHLQHHARLNQPDDPNHLYVDGPFWQLPLRYVRAIPFLRKLSGDPRTRTQKAVDGLLPCTVIALYVLAWRAGVLRDLLLLWFTPAVFAKIIMDWYVNYLPHAGLPSDRFRGTRIVAVPWLTPLVLGHNYHAIHHLWPPVPWHRYRAVFNKERDYLRENGVPIEYSVIRDRTRPAESVRHDAVVD